MKINIPFLMSLPETGRKGKGLVKAVLSHQPGWPLAPRKKAARSSPSAIFAAISSITAAVSRRLSTHMN